MRNAFIKDVYREIVNTKGRFFGILAIVALGVAFFAGLGATGYDMKLTGYQYFNDRQLMDIRVISTYGLNENDVSAIRNVPGVGYAYATYTMDAQAAHKGNTANIKLHAYDSDAAVNQPSLLYGSLPQKSNEAVVEESFLSGLGYAVGDTVVLQSGKSSDLRNKLRSRSFVITGVIQSSYYISRERGTSSIGRGEVDYYMMIPQSNFLSEVYTEVFIRVEGADEINCFSDEYKDRVDTVVTAVEDAGKVRVEERAREMTANAYGKLKAAEQALDRNLTETRLLLDKAETGLTGASESLPGSYASLTETLADITAQERGLDEDMARVISGLNTVRDTEASLDAQEESLYASRREVMDVELYLGSEFTERLRDIDDGINAVTAARVALTEQRSALYKSFNELAEGKAQLREAVSAVYDGGRSLVSGGYDLRNRETELAAERQTLTATLEAARLTLEQQREDLDDLDDPKWYVLDRDTNPGYSSYSDDSSKIEAIGRVFPLIFFIVAALVCLTSMTRLVEERRTEIGTLKSLGYGNTKIVSKYLFYATLPTLIGGLAGGCFGMLFFPKIIITAYNMLYTLPAPTTPMNPTYLSTGLAMGLASTVLATTFACINELRETPSNLLRPKAPKAGKRNMLERITFFWRRLTFIQKVTVRNLLRYKKRLYMTVIGIGGCTALLMTGFGLQDSISDIINKQFNELNLYSLIVSFTDSAPEKDVSHAVDTLTADSICLRSLKARQKTFDAGAAGGGKNYQVSLVVPETVSGLDHFFVFRDRASHEQYTLNDNGVIITEKLSRMLNIKVNDRIELIDGDDVRVTVRVTAVTETYFQHYVYMTSALYEEVFGEKPVNNTVFAILSDLSETDAAREDALAQTLLDDKGVNSVYFIKSTVKNFGNVIENLNFVVFVLIVSAGALALVVLLNLTSININERIRELATIEVLGFYDREVSAYIYRENAVLTAIGAAVGLVLGYFLHLYVILTAETDIMMFGREIKPLSYLLSVAFTFFFALVVNLLTANKLKKINMVEALKSVE